MKKTKLQIMREKKGLTRKELAIQMYKKSATGLMRDVSHYAEYLREVESYKAALSPHFQNIIAQALDCSFKDLEDENLDNLTVAELIKELQGLNQDKLITISLGFDRFGFLGVIEADSGELDMILGSFVDELVEE